MLKYQGYMRFFYITLLILGTIFIIPNFALGADLPSECPAGDYNVVVDDDGTSGDDFITISAGNSANIDGNGGNDCILVGDGNTGVILGGTGNDVIIAGNINNGKIDGEGGDDIIKAGNNNSGNLLGGTSIDSITVGDNNLGQIKGEGGSDTLAVGNNNSGDVFGGTEADSVTVGNDNSGWVRSEGGDDAVVVGNDNSGNVSGGTSTDTITIGNNNSGDVESEGGDDIINLENFNSGLVEGGTGIDTITIGSNNSGNVELNGGDDTVTLGEVNFGNITGDDGDDTVIYGYGNTGAIDAENQIAIPPAPSADPLPETFNSIQNVTLSSDGAELIFYTTEDDVVLVCNEDEEIGEFYEEPIPVLSTKTITAIACAEEGYSSPVASFTYTIELKTDSAGLSSVLEAVFAPASGESISLTQSLTLTQDLEINTTASGSKVVLNEATVITRVDIQAFDASTLVSSETAISSLAGLTEGQVVEAALRWGIPNISLEFNPAISISIFVGDSLSGQTLNVNRSITGIDGWTTDGIVSPATCLVVGGICSFQATKASVYAAITVIAPIPAPAPVVSSGGGGGTIWFPSLYNPVSNTIPAPISNDVKPIESPVSIPPLSTPLLSTPTPVVKIALAPKPKVVISKNIQRKIIQEKNNEVAIISTTVSENAKKSFVLSLIASMGRLFSYPFSFWK